MRITGNKGEWSELYAMLKLLSLGKLYAANENGERINDIYFPITKIIRHENGDTLEYEVDATDYKVNLYINKNQVTSFNSSYFAENSNNLFDQIQSGGDRAFAIPDIQNVMTELHLNTIAAPSSDKTDISLQIHDINTGFSPVCGFSIKSELGSSPTLLNASGATNFIFEVNGLSDEDAESINAIETRSKIIDRVKAITEKGSIKYSKLENGEFSSNLMLIDSYMEDIIADMLLDYYLSNESNCQKLISRIEERNPLGYPREGFYKFKFKKFLCSIALGMTPSKPWDGKDEANGGYVIVKQDGDVLAYHIYNRDAFEEYLLNNTKLERASTTRHNFASLYKQNGKMYIKLNLQIRFI